tara:strand:- start:42 stop:293 length:252 start_codon:yes stop_codon:yes gene_type:complete
MSTQTKFTKGNWDWEHDESTSSMIQVDSDIGVSIARLQGEDNAYLIAAAPEMYAKLEEILCLEGFINTSKIKALLAKARGEST